MMRFRSRTNSNIPAVVVGMETGGLGVVRSLGSRGVPVVAVDESVRKPEISTRFAKERVKIPIRSPELIDGLIELSRKYSERPVLIATVRIPLLLISENRGTLEKFYRLALPPHDTLVAMENKVSLVALAKAADVEIPRTLILSDERALEEAAELRYPVLLKPADNDIMYMRRFKKAYVVGNHSELRELVHRIWPSYLDMVAQEWIAGGDSNIYFCLQYRGCDGRVLASFVGRKLFSWPPGKGATAACTAATAHIDAVEQLSNRLLDSAGVSGFAGVEFKLDPRTQRLFLIEPTVGRTDQQEEIASLNGINLPFISYCDQIGQPIPLMVQTRQSHTWFNPQATRWARQEQLAAGDEAPALRVGGGRVCSAYFRYNDPLPGLMHFGQRVQEAVLGGR